MTPDLVARRLSARPGRPADGNGSASIGFPPHAVVSRLADQVLQFLLPGLTQDSGTSPPDLELSGRLIRYGPEAGVERQLRNFEVELHAALVRCFAATGEPQPERRASVVTAAMVPELPELREALWLDAQAAFQADPSVHSVAEAIHCLPGLTALALQRFAHALYVLGAPVLPRLLTEVGHARTGCDIHPGARIGRSFFIDHATGVVIGETATIGRNVRIYHGVTLGAKSFDRDQSGALRRGTKRHPDIEDDVTIYAHATILGGDTRIGAGSIIGSNVWLTRSVPPRSVAFITGAHVIIQPREMAGGDWQI